MMHAPAPSPCRFLRYGILAALCAAPAAASAGTIRVPADQATIQAGIDAASAGDTVLVAPGTYSGAGNRNLDFGGVDIVLTSEGGPAVTIIDGNSEFDGLANGFIFRNGETSASVVENITIRNCWAPAHPTYGNSGGGMLTIGASPTVSFVTFVDNSANGGSGAGIACIDGASPLITFCAFTGGYTNNYGSAVFCTQGSSPTIVDCRADGNAGNGAIAVVDSGPTIQATRIRGNQGVDSRGGSGTPLCRHQRCQRLPVPDLRQQGQRRGPGRRGRDPPRHRGRLSRQLCRRGQYLRRRRRGNPPCFRVRCRHHHA